MQPDNNIDLFLEALCFLQLWYTVMIYAGWLSSNVYNITWI
jgi:hypothetical protein